MAEVVLAVVRGSSYNVRWEQVRALQHMAGEVENGIALFRRFLRLKPQRIGLSMTPVAAGHLLQAVETLVPHLLDRTVPGIAFADGDGELGAIFQHDDGYLAEQNGARLAADPTGIRIETDEIPPPAGFRDGYLGHYCHVKLLRRQDGLWQGDRLNPVGTARLEQVPLPHVSRWDRLARRGDPTSLEYRLALAAHVYRDTLATLTGACSESVRTMQPLLLREG